MLGISNLVSKLDKINLLRYRVGGITNRATSLLLLPVDSSQMVLRQLRTVRQIIHIVFSVPVGIGHINFAQIFVGIRYHEGYLSLAVSIAENPFLAPTGTSGRLTTVPAILLRVFMHIDNMEERAAYAVEEIAQGVGVR
jgi:hypothetical protein